MTRLARSLLVGMVLALVAGACGGSDDSVEQSSRTVTVFGPYRESDANHFTASLEAFTEATGIEVRYTGTGAFVADLRRRTLETANPPDVAMIPQPGLVTELLDRGFVRPLSPMVTDAVAQHYSPQAADTGEIDGTAVAVPYRANVKSLVWFRPDLFAAGGYEIPSSLGELEALVAQIKTDGVAPWCVTIEAQRATGWVATDWVEDLLLRTAGIQVYDDWVTGDIGFADERIEAAFDLFRELALEPGFPAGGIGRVLRIPVREAHNLLFDDPAGCMLHRQASFAGEWLPAGIEQGVDVDFFVLPGEDAAEQPPLLVGGDLAVALTDSPEAQELLAYLATPESGRVWAELGSYVSFQQIADPQTYYGPADLRVVELLQQAEILRFDGSDSMPAAIGSDLFWRLITEWAAGTLSYDDLAAQLDTARAAEGL